MCWHFCYNAPGRVGSTKALWWTITHSKTGPMPPHLLARWVWPVDLHLFVQPEVAHQVVGHLDADGLHGVAPEVVVADVCGRRRVPAKHL